MGVEYGVGRVTMYTRAVWTAPSGRHWTGLVPATAGTATGAVVPIWTDRDGTLVPEPVGPVETALLGVMSGLGVLVVGGCALGVCWLLVRRAVDAHNAASWKQEWERVGPEWSRHLR